MVIEVKLLQLEKHHFPKLVTDDGMVTEVKPVQSLKHPPLNSSPMMGW